ncbi:DUF1345 domain-containing protein [Uliginosibacterium flavum]|uniref:DUF1345 domain-containing protein n=1 Tax=Uliginosibacterium flavum TaxID=1396831 RepID=A0ABV2TGE0_9RHOO
MNPQTLSEAPLHTRNIILRVLRAHKRLFASALIASLTLFLLPYEAAAHLATRLLVSWNAGVWSYLLLAAIMVARATPAHMRWRARVEDEGRRMILAGVVLATLACLVAVFVQLTLARDLHEFPKYAHIALAALTMASAWAFVHLIFALHYAHDFYSDRGRKGNGGLQFPGTEKPDYLDFIYFATVIGTSGQTADISFTSPHLRRIGLCHCVLAYAFNTTMLALTINIASGLL